MSYYNDRPKLTASRNRFYRNESKNYNNNYYSQYDRFEPRQGVKRPYDKNDDDNQNDNHTKSKRYKSYEQVTKVKKVCNENKTDNNSQPSKSTDIQIKNIKTIEINKKNIASNRLIQLRKNLELSKPDNIGNSNVKETTSEIKKIETVQKKVFQVSNKTPQKSASNRLKDIRNSASKSTVAKNKTNCPLTSSNKNPKNDQLIQTYENKPKTLADRLKVNNNFNASASKDPSRLKTTTIMSPVKLEKKIDKIGFTNDWIAHTNFDGDTSSFMEVSTQAQANNTVANLDSVNSDVAEMEWTSEISTKKMFQGKQIKNHDVCIVVDTNIFIHNLGIIKDILKIKVSGATIPIVYIPWMVITELDYIKDSSHDLKLKKSASTAIKYINEILYQKNSRLICQTVFDVDKQKEMGSAPDDKIISCCLQALETYDYVFLFSNDINLKNKAMIHNIPALSANEVIIRIMAKLNKAVKVQAVMSKMSMLCSHIIMKSVKECYGPVWSKMDMLTSDQPWPFIKCLKIFKRYWAAIFKDKILKQFIKSIDETLTFISKLAHICDDSKEYMDFVKLCVTLCIFLKDFKEHKDMVETTIKDITNIS